jgi:hypothetical protein
VNFEPNFELIVARGRTWDLDELPPRAIALDGAVRGPVVDAEHQRFSFDHHDHCIRLATSATCVQVFDALAMGLDPAGFTVVVNDVDGDTALAVALLANPGWVRNERVAALVDVVGKVDAHGPAYPLVGERAALADTFARGAMAPVADAHRARTYATADLRRLLVACVEGIEALVTGEVHVPAPDVDTRTYTITHRGEQWVMVASDEFVFDLVYADGIDAAIAYQGKEDGSTTYTLARRSDLVAGFAVPAILTALAGVEPGWGGGSSIGGSPRNPDGSSSRLTPDQVFEIVTAVLAG